MRAWEGNGSCASTVEGIGKALEGQGRAVEAVTGQGRAAGGPTCMPCETKKYSAFLVASSGLEHDETVAITTCNNGSPRQFER